MITIEEGRKAYNSTRVGLGAGLEVYRMKSHETAVEAFFARAEAERPEEFARVAAKYPVLSERQLEDRRATELFAFSGGEDVDDDGNGVEVSGSLDLGVVASLRSHASLQERQAEARRRGESIPLVISSWAP